MVSQNEADEEPGGGRLGPDHGGGDALGKAQEAHGPAEAQRDGPAPVLRDGGLGVGQGLHKGLVDPEDHRQHPAGDPRQDGSRPDEGPTEEVPQGSDAPMGRTGMGHGDAPPFAPPGRAAVSSRVFNEGHPRLARADTVFRGQDKSKLCMARCRAPARRLP